MNIRVLLPPLQINQKGHKTGYEPHFLEKGHRKKAIIFVTLSLHIKRGGGSGRFASESLTTVEKEPLPPIFSYHFRSKQWAQQKREHTVFPLFFTLPVTLSS